MQITVEIDTDAVYIPAADATFMVHAERYEREPYSWGETRGSEVSAVCALRTLKIAGLILTKAQATALIGPEEVKRIEKQAEEKATAREAA